MSGRKVFTAGEVLQAADVNDFLMDQSVMVFAGTAARGSAIPSPTEGMVTYLADSDEVEVFDGSAYKPVGPGKILQVVQVTKNDTFSTSSTSFTDITGLSASITPSSASNKVLILAQLMGDNSSSDIFMLQLFRDSTAIHIGDAAGAQIRTTAIVGNFQANRPSMSPVMFLDSPATTSAVTYKFQGRVNSGTGHINRVTDDSSATFYFRNASSIILMEVAG